jgi:putative SOS response-associated peptidase YedK
MCGRFNLRLSPTELQEFFDLFRAPEVVPRFNIAPLQPVLTVTVEEAGYRAGKFRQWGFLPSWAKSPAEGAHMINARSESAASKPAFRTAFRLRRCLIPASGFYEWERIDKRTVQPWHITLRSGEPMAFAGLWERWTGPDQRVLETCTILTTAANDFMAVLHDRMPVILPRAAFSTWLDPLLTDPEALAPWLVPCPADWLTRTPVSTAVNHVRNDGPECLLPAQRQRSLFDNDLSSDSPGPRG